MNFSKKTVDVLADSVRKGIEELRKRQKDAKPASPVAIAIPKITSAADLALRVWADDRDCAVAEELYNVNGARLLLHNAAISAFNLGLDAGLETV